MAAPRAAPRHLQPDIIDVVSDTPNPEPIKVEEMPDYDDGVPFLFDEAVQAEPAPPAGPALVRGQYVKIDGEEIFIPDEDEGPAQPAAGVRTPSDDFGVVDGDAMVAATLNAEFTVDTCLQRVLEIFPEISHDYVRKLYNHFDNNGDYEILPGEARLDNIMEQLISGSSYPKQEKGKKAARKRKREDSIDESADTARWERADREIAPGFLKGSMQAMLKAEFPDIPHTYIGKVLTREKHLFQSYVALAKAKDDPNAPVFRGRASSTNFASAITIATNAGWPDLEVELQAARQRVEVIRRERAVEEAKKRAEAENLQKAKDEGATSECQACFEELPLNRQIHCDGLDPHFTCYNCALTYIKSEVGDSRCNVLCTAGCGAPFPPHQLNLLDDKPLLHKLAGLEQEKAIRDAGLEDLEECPFCDYKAIMPPIEEDFEFHCRNPECEKTSCRRCKSVSHIPVSCEEHAKENKINSRHKIEEAMTAALIRSCNKCKKQFIKEYGCNKMTCTSCGNLQCYVCSETVKDYDHFDQNNPGARGLGVAGSAKASKQCPLYDNVEERHEREVKQAEEAARAEVLAENPDINQADLDFKVPNAVKKSATDRARQVRGRPAPFAGNLANGDFAAMLGAGGVEPEDVGRIVQQWQAQRLGVPPAPVVNLQAARQGPNPQLALLAQQQEIVLRQRRAQMALEWQLQQAQAAVQQEGMRMMAQEGDPRLRAGVPYNPRVFIAQRVVPQLQPQPQGFIPVYGFAPQMLPRWMPAPAVPQVPDPVPQMARPPAQAVPAPVVNQPAPRQPTNGPADAPVFFDVFQATLQGDGIDPLQRPANDGRLRGTLYRVDPAPANGGNGAAVNPPAPADPFGRPANHAAGIRQQRVGLEHLENLRVAHDERMRARARTREQMERARQRVEETNRLMEEVNQRARIRNRRC